MKDSRFSYHGCSQAKGFISGNWSMNDQMIYISPKQQDEQLDTGYILKGSILIPINGQEGELTRC